ncbi:hypothetical protein D9M68_832740 [compost metagenome]
MLQLQSHPHLLGHLGREVQGQAALLFTGHPQLTGLAGERQAIARLLIELEQYVGAGQGRMAAKRHFGPGREPADVPATAFLHQEGCFRKIVLGGDALHELVVEPGIEPIDHRGIAAEGALAESVDLMEIQLHEKLLEVGSKSYQHADHRGPTRHTVASFFNAAARSV